jgi:hypothetical protein
MIDYIKNKIIEYENNFPVDEWSVDGVHVWPYIRIKLYIHLLSDLNDKSNKQQAITKIVKSRNLINKIKFPFKFIKSYYKLLSFFINLKQKNLIFFGSHFHRSNHMGIYFNRFFDSMIDNHNLKSEIYTIEFQKVYNQNFNQSTIIPLNKILNEYKLIQKLKPNSSKKLKTIKLEGFGLFIQIIKKDIININKLNIDEGSIVKWAIKIKKNSAFFKRMYNIVQPKRLIFLSYYGFDDLTSAIIAAHQLNIPVIDFQHGPQTNVHMAYCYWTKIPQKGFNTMPTEYWNWDKISSENIEKWANKTEAIKSKIVGHPYLEYWIKKTSTLENKKKLILYSLQTFALKDMFPEVIINLINNSSNIWVLRLHPRSNFDETQLTLFLKSKNVNEANFIIQDSIQVPLPETIANSLLHLTSFSGCLIEARMMGVPTILIHELGKEVFENYIDNDLVYYRHSSEDNFVKEYLVILNNAIKLKKRIQSNKIVNPLLV